MKSVSSFSSIDFITCILKHFHYFSKYPIYSIYISIYTINKQSLRCRIKKIVRIFMHLKAIDLSRCTLSLCSFKLNRRNMARILPVRRKTQKKNQSIHFSLKVIYVSMPYPNPSPSQSIS